MKLKVNIPLQQSAKIRGGGDLINLFDRSIKFNSQQYVSELRNFRTQIMSIENDIFSCFQNVKIYDQKKNAFQKIYQRMSLKFDELLTDVNSYEMIVFSQILDETMKVLRISYQNVLKFMNYHLKNNSVLAMNQQTSSKNRLNLCQKCHKQVQQINIDKLKIEYGLLYEQQYKQKNKQNKQKNKNIKNQQQQFQDLSLRITNILKQRQTISNIISNNNKYRQLAEHIDDTHLRFQQEKDIQNIQKYQIQSQKQYVFSSYDSIINQIRQIFKNRLNNGYSYKVKSMLQQFQNVLDHHTIRKVQKKNFINVVDASIETQPSQYQAQIKLLKYQIKSRDEQLKGIKQNRGKIEEKYIKILTKQRQINIDRGSILAKAQQSEIFYKKLLQQKQIDLQQVKENLKRVKIKLERVEKQNKIMYSCGTQTIDLFQQKCTNQTQTDPFQAISSKQSFKNVRRSKNLSRRMSSVMDNKQLKKQVIITLDKQLKLSINNIFNFCFLFKQRNKVFVVEQFNNKQFIQTNKHKQKLENKSQFYKNTSNKETKQQKQNVQLFKLFSNQSTKSINNKTNLYKKPSTTRLMKQTHQNKINKQQKLQKLQKVQNQIFYKTNSTIVQNNNPNKQNLQYNRIVSNKTNNKTIIKFHQRQSSQIHKQQLKQILDMFKREKRQISTLPTQHIPNRQSQNQKINIIKCENIKQQSIDSKKIVQLQSSNSIIDNIQIAKNLIQSEYNFLKANGYIDYLLTMHERYHLGSNKYNKSKYKFKFCDIIPEDLNIFGGYEEMLSYCRQIGIWKRYKNDENKLKLYFKHENFAKKISKYLSLLKKMNQQYFYQYIYFIVDPQNFSQKYFKNIKQNKNSSRNSFINGNAFMNFERHDLSNQAQWKQIFVRLIRYHHEMHNNCDHISAFLQKIGYYRYSI